MTTYIGFLLGLFVGFLFGILLSVVIRNDKLK